MKTYIVKYKSPHRYFWTTLKNITGDGIEDGFRWFVDDENRLIHIPLFYEVKFSKERHIIITLNMSKEIGQPIQTN